MPGYKFRRMTEAWTPELLGAFMSRRYALLTEEQGHICTPGSTPAHAPFYDSDYPYLDRIGQLNEAPWPALKRMDPKVLLHPDLFEHSKVRTAKDGTACYRAWDAAIAVPACDLRTFIRHNLSRIPIVRNINEHWTIAMREALSYVGPLGPHGKILRPTGPYVLDLPAMGEFGWTLREAIHVLAHLRGDPKRDRARVLERNKISPYVQDAAAQVAYSVLFDVPIDVTPRAQGHKHGPDSYYNVELKSTSYVKAPVVRLPWMGDEALRVDDTLAVMLAAVFIEPVPYGFLAGTSASNPEDRWAGGPSIVVMVGWEGIDYLTHMPLGRFTSNANSTTDYVIRGEALLSPDTHWAYLALAARARPCPETPAGGRWQYVRDWIESDEYHALRAQTPGLPCKSCYLVNRDTEGAPKRPKGRHPKGVRKTWPREWHNYYTELDLCLQIGQKAVDDYEPLYYSKVKYPRLLRRDRNAAHARKTKMIKTHFRDEDALAMALRKVGGQSSGRMTANQRRVYEQYTKEQIDAQKRAANSGA